MVAATTYSRNKIFRLHAFFMVLFLRFCTQASGKVRIKSNCGEDGRRDIRQALDFLISVKQKLKRPPFKLHARRLKRRRIRRNINRKLRKGRIGCHQGVLCRKNQDNRIGMHPFGSWGRKTRICYHKMQHDNYTFCDLVNTIAHELGHAAGISWLHVGRRGRRVYKFGDYAKELCENAGLDRPLLPTASPTRQPTVSPTKSPTRRPTPSPTQLKLQGPDLEIIAVDGQTGQGTINVYSQDVHVRASAVDERGQSISNIRWYTSREDLQNTYLGIGESVTVHLAPVGNCRYCCYPAKHILTARVETLDGTRMERSRQVQGGTCVI